MFDRNSDYALNKKDPDAIVCKSSTGVHIRLTRLDFSSQEEFEKWKQWSDESYHAIEKADHRHSNRTISLDGLAELSFAVLSAETEVMDQYDREERARLCRLLAEGLDACLTAPQRRRLLLYAVDGFTEKAIADIEQVRQQNVSKRIASAKKILKKFLQKGGVN